MNYHNITYPDMNNGDGLRVVLWLSGCTHKCFKCQNPQTWNPQSGILFDIQAKQEILDELGNEYISGITLSGGDPLHPNNVNGVLSLLCNIRELYGDSKTVWLYTGFTLEQLFLHHDKNTSETESVRMEIVKMCDVIVDGQYIDALRDVTLKWRGSSNQRVIDMRNTLERGEIVLWTV